MSHTTGPTIVPWLVCRHPHQPYHPPSLPQAVHPSKGGQCAGHPAQRQWRGFAYRGTGATAPSPPAPSGISVPRESTGGTGPRSVRTLRQTRITSYPQQTLPESHKLRVGVCSLPVPRWCKLDLCQTGLSVYTVSHVFISCMTYAALTKGGRPLSVYYAV